MSYCRFKQCQVFDPDNSTTVIVTSCGNSFSHSHFVAVFCFSVHKDMCIVGYAVVYFAPTVCGANGWLVHMWPHNTASSLPSCTHSLKKPKIGKYAYSFCNSSLISHFVLHRQLRSCMPPSDLRRQSNSITSHAPRQLKFMVANQT